MQSFDDGLALHQQGRLADAERIYRGVLVEQPNHPGALHLLGVIHQQRGAHETAVELIGRAIAVNPDKAVYHNNRAAALLSLHRYEEAVQSLSRALEIRPDYVDALSNLGMAQTALGQEQAAISALKRVLELDPRNTEALRLLASVLHAAGQAQAAIDLYTRAIADGATPQTLLSLGNHLMTCGPPENAIEVFRQVIAMQPGNGLAHFCLAMACEDTQVDGDVPRLFRRASELCPDKPLWRFRADICGPLAFDSTKAIDAWRGQLSHTLATWRSKMPPKLDVDEIALAGVFPKLALSYHGRNSRAIKEQFATLFEPYFGNSPPPSGSGNRHRPRIGIVVTRRHEGMFLRSMQGIIENLAAEPFELLLFGSNSIMPKLQEIRRDDLRIVPFGSSLHDATRTIRDARCDLIYYWEVGTDAVNYFLPFAPLAPVQCTGWGSTITSGVPAIVTANGIPQPVQRQYASEKLRFESRRLDHREVSGRAMWQSSTPITPRRSPCIWRACRCCKSHCSSNRN